VAKQEYRVLELHEVIKNTILQRVHPVEECTRGIAKYPNGALTTEKLV